MVSVDRGKLFLPEFIPERAESYSLRVLVSIRTTSRQESLPAAVCEFDLNFGGNDRRLLESVRRGDSL